MDTDNDKPNEMNKANRIAPQLRLIRIRANGGYFGNKAAQMMKMPTHWAQKTLTRSSPVRGRPPGCPRHTVS